MKKQTLGYLILGLILILTGTTKAIAHGAKIIYEEKEAIAIQANFDDGTPMKNAQVVVYAPNDPATPWLKGTTDEQGNFLFVPDPTQSGNWDVKVRLAGHGDLISIPLVAEGKLEQTPPPTNNAQYTPLQTIVMAAAGIWGMVGTALFFSQRRKVKD
jgi:nickel transport protein